MDERYFEQAALIEQAGRDAAVHAAQRRLTPSGVEQCLTCAAPIAPARLRALPSAAHCLPCQQLLERQHRLGR